MWRFDNLSESEKSKAVQFFKDKNWVELKGLYLDRDVVPNCVSCEIAVSNMKEWTNYAIQKGLL